MNSIEVQVTKDAFGVVVWPVNEEIVYSSGPDDSGPQSPSKSNWNFLHFSSQKKLSGWIRNKITFFPERHQILTSKQMKRYFPHIGELWANGHKSIMSLKID